MVVVVAMVVAVIIVAVGFHHVPVLPVHDVLILNIHWHMFDHVTSVMCIHVLFQSVVFAPIFVQIAVVFSTVFVRVVVAVWLITIAIMARVGIPMPCAMKIVAIPVRSMTINLMARVIINTATMVTVIVVVLDHNLFHLLVDVVVVVILSDVAVMLIMIFVVACGGMVSAFMIIVGVMVISPLRLPDLKPNQTDHNCDRQGIHA